MIQSQDAKPVIRTAAFGAVGLLLVLASGVIHGRLTQRWGDSDALSRCVSVVDAFPTEFGDWKSGRGDQGEMDQSVIDTLQCASAVTRDYHNSKTGDTVSVFVIVGPPGPTAVHTPEICYPAQAFEQIGDTEAFEVTDGDNRGAFWRVAFESRWPSPSSKTVYYAWSDDGAWRASKAPRFEYGGSDHLFKIQLSTDTAGMDTAEQSDRACQDFLTDLLKCDWRPVLDDSPR